MFDLDLWPLEVIWGQNIFYHLKGHIWLPIWLPWTPSLYLVPFLRYSTSKFKGFDLDLWPLKVIWGQKKFTIRKAIYDFLFDFYGHQLSISYLFEIFNFKVFWVWPWPLTPKGHLGSKKFLLFERPCMTSYLTSMDTISLSRTVSEIFEFQGFDLDLWPLKVIWGQKISYHWKTHIWLPIFSKV